MTTIVHNSSDSPFYPIPPSALQDADGVDSFHILHPGHSSHNRIIELPILDPVRDSNPPRFGFHHGTALMICFIITGNRPGFLSPTRIESDDPTTIVTPPTDPQPDFDSVLLETQYYYYIYGAKLDEKYTVLGDPQQWTFPAQTILNQFHWNRWEAVLGENRPRGRRGDRRTTNVSQAVRNRDRVCRLTGTPAECGCQSAHIIPAAMEDWFFNNEMVAYAKDAMHEAKESTRPSNMLLLRADIHIVFDQFCFAFVPKEGQLVAHFVLYEPWGTCRAFHNALLGRPQDLSAAYVLSRLAFTVIPMAEHFYRRHVQPPAKATKRRAHGGSGDGARGKKSRPPRDNRNDSSDIGTSAISTPRNTDADADAVIDEERELEDDMRIAMLRLPHVFGPNLDESDTEDARSVGYYGGLAESLGWYPGHRKIERMKEEYMKANPQVRATSNRGAEESSSDSGSESVLDA